MADIELARAFVEIIPTVRGVQGNLGEAFAPAEKEADASGKRSGKRFAGGLSGALKVGAAGVAAAGAGVAVATKGFYEAGSVFDGMTDTIKIGSGTSGAALDELRASALDVGNSIPTNFDLAGEAIASLNTYLGATGEPLEAMTEGVLEASRMLGEDGAANAEAFGKSMAQWQRPADEGADVLDTLFVGTQKYGLGLDETIGHLNTYGSVLQNAGFTMEESAALFGQLESGGISVSRVMPGLNKSFRDWASEGKDVQAELAGTVDAIENAESSTEALSLATDVFGAEGAQRMTTAIRSGKFELEDLSEALGDTEGAIGDTAEATMSFPEQWQMFKNAALVAIEPIATAVFDLAGDLMGPLTTAMQSVSGIFETIATGEFNPENWGDGIEEDSGLVGFALRIHEVFDALRPAFDWIGEAFDSLDLDTVGGALSPVVDGFAELAPVVMEAFSNLSPLSLIFQALEPVLPVLGEAIGELAGILGGALSSVLESLLPAVGSILGTLGPVLATVIESVIPVVIMIAEAVAPVIEMLADALVPVIDLIAEVFVALMDAVMPLVDSLLGMVSAVLEPLLEVVVALLDPLLALAGLILEVALDAIGALLPVVEWLADLLAVVADVIGDVLGVALEWLADAIPPIVEGIVGSFEWLGDVFDWLGQLAGDVWAGISDAIGAVVDWVTGTLVPALSTAWDAVSDAMSWLYESVILPVWDGIKIAIAVVVAYVSALLDAWVWIFENVWAPVFTWLYESIILPVWEGIKTAITAVVDYVSLVIDGWVLIFKHVLAPVFTWLYESVILPVWEGIQAAIDAVVVWFRDTAWPALSTVIENVKRAFRIMRDTLRDVWAFVRDRVIDPVVTWLRDVAWGGIIAPTIDNIRSGFETMRDTLKAAWEFVRYDVIQPVADWFRDTIGGLFDRVTGGIGDAFESLRDTVKAVWEGIRDTAKEPVRFVVEDIVRDGIVAKYNEVASIFGVTEVDLSRFTVGWSGGGYTGPGAKYAPAGVVHADEYVIQKSSQNSIRNRAPGFLDALNRHGAAALDMLGYATGGWVRPFRGNYGINSQYGMRNGRMHAGVDFPTPSGTPLVAVSDGSVVDRGYHSAAGNHLRLQTDLPGIVAGYHHMSRFAAQLGESVGRGDVLGYSGNTGRSTGPHLHFSIKRDGEYVDPNPYLNGTGIAGDGVGGWGWNPFAGLWDGLKDRVRDAVGDSMFGDMLFEVPQKMIGDAMGWVTDKLAALGDFASDTVTAVGGRARWSPVASQALMMTGEFGPLRLGSLLNRMGQESSFDPRAINTWDSNAAAGTPSKGLMQVIDPTFAAYRDDRAPNDIWDPLANILASIHYTKDRYGDLRTGWDRSGGYADGGLVDLFDTGGWMMPGRPAINLTDRLEPVFTGAQWDILAKNIDENVNGGRRQRFGDLTVQVMPPDEADPSTFGRRVGEALELELLSLEEV